MTDEVRLWDASGDELKEIDTSTLDLEDRIHKWVERDISILDPDLLVIGKEVQTAFGKSIDLLCIDSTGNLVIVELKRDKTPREVTAQALDYASWVKDLKREEIQKIATDYFRKKGIDTTLQAAFRAEFDTDLPEVINEHHAMRIVAAEIDDGTERIIRYLSETYGVDLNAVRFHFFQATDGRQLLARTFTVPLKEAEVNIKKGPEKRLPPPSKEEMEERASNAGVGDLYKKVRDALAVAPDLRSGTTNTTLVFLAETPNGARRVIFHLVPGESSVDKGLRYRLYSKRLADLIGLDEAQIKEHLPTDSEPYEPWVDAQHDYRGWTGYIKSGDDLQKIVGLLKQRTKVMRSRPPEKTAKVAGG
jgi:hypothetical protein